MPVWFETIVNRLHAKTPEDRYQRADELARLLRDCLAHVQTAGAVLPTELLPSTPSHQKQTVIASLESGRIRRRSFGVAAILVIAVMAAIYFLSPTPAPQPKPTTPSARAAIAPPRWDSWDGVLPEEILTRSEQLIQELDHDLVPIPKEESP